MPQGKYDLQPYDELTGASSKYDLQPYNEPTEKLGYPHAIWNAITEPNLPERPSTVPEFKNTLKNFGVSDTVSDYTSYLPRFGDWMYENVARPSSSLLGIA